jgi:hemerythrin-like domain-containing protein
LEFLWKVKQYKDNNGKDEFYAEKQPAAWQLAKEALGLEASTLIEGKGGKEMQDVFEDLYERIKHGDQQHQEWLKAEMTKYLNEINKKI